MYWLRRRRAEIRIKETEEILESVKEEQSAVLWWSSLWGKALEEIEKNIALLSRERQQQTWELEQSKRNFDSLIKAGYASASNLKASKERLDQASEELRKAKEHAEALIEEQKKTQEENKKAREELEKGQKALEDADRKWQEYNLRLKEEKEQREAWNNEKGRLEAELQQIRAKLSFLGKDILELKNKKTEAPDTGKNIDAEIKKLEKERDRFLKEQEETASVHGALYAKVQTLAAELQRARREASNARSKLNEVTEAMQADLYPRPVQYLLSAARLNRLDASPHAVVDVFTCDPQYSAALEAYLGGRQFQLLVEDLRRRPLHRQAEGQRGRKGDVPAARKVPPQIPRQAVQASQRG